MTEEGPSGMSDTDRVGTEPVAVCSTKAQPNRAASLGALLVIFSFFLPWFYLGESSRSGFELVLREEAAEELLARFDIMLIQSTEDGAKTVSANAATRPLLLAPLLALSTLALDSSKVRGTLMRILVRGLIGGAGALLAGAFAWFGISVMVIQPTPMYWMVVLGGLLIALGSLFDIIRGT